MQQLLVIWDYGKAMSHLCDKVAALCPSPTHVTLVAFVNQQIEEQFGHQDTVALQQQMQHTLERLPTLAASYRLEIVHSADMTSWVSQHLANHACDLVAKVGHRTEQWFYTPTDWQLIRSIQTPLLLTASNPGRSQSHVVAAVDLLNPHRSQQQLNQKVAKYSADAATQLAAELHMTQVIAVSEILRDLDVRDPQSVLTRQGPEVLAQLQQWLSQQQLTTVKPLVLAGVVEQELQHVCQQLHPSLVVLGSIGREGVAGALIGNTAERILQHLRADVLVIKP